MLMSTSFFLMSSRYAGIPWEEVSYQTLYNVQAWQDETLYILRVYALNIAFMLTCALLDVTLTFRPQAKPLTPFLKLPVMVRTPK